MSDFLTQLRYGRTLLMDGAMGTLLECLLGCSRVECGERLNLQQPELVRSIHQSYVDAGAEVLLTNTFQANANALFRQGRLEGLDEREEEIWHAAIRLARSVKPRFVLADIGPIENCTWDIAAELMDHCKSADGVLLETWSSIDDLRRFADQCTADSLPLLISFTFHRTHDLATFIGAMPEDCAAAAARFGAAAIGANCGKEIGMTDMVEIVKRYRKACDLPVFVRPNAGSPSKTGLSYPRTPDAMAAALLPLLEEGVAMVGGCCGTTPEHIRRFRDVLDDWQRARKSPGTTVPGL
jgi:methionine synthase I (cobalamin-dependent)